MPENGQIPAFPLLNDVPVHHRGVTGRVWVSILDHDAVTVVADERPLLYAGEKYYGNLSVRRDPHNGTWSIADTVNGTWSADEARTPSANALTMVENAMIMAVAEAWTPELGMVAAYVGALHQLRTLNEQRRTKRAQIAALYTDLERLDGARTACMRLLRDNAPADEAWPEADQETAVVQVWRHPDPSKDAVRIAYGEDTEPIYEVPTGTAELVEVDDVPGDWVRLVPLPDPE